MIDNIDVAYCMAKLEDKIRREWNSAKFYLECRDGVEDPVYGKIITRWSTMIGAFEVAFGVDYF
jgi:hypothetical protein